MTMQTLDPKRIDAIELDTAPLFGKEKEAWRLDRRLVLRWEQQPYIELYVDCFCTMLSAIRRGSTNEKLYQLWTGNWPNTLSVRTLKGDIPDEDP